MPSKPENNSAQSIPNPNQDRLGFPSTPDKGQQPSREPAQRDSHRRAVLGAQQLSRLAAQLRNALKSADPATPLPGQKTARQIEKLARQVRSELK